MTIIFSYKVDFNSQSNLPSNNTIFINSPVNPYTSFEYSKQRNMNFLKLEGRGEAINTLPTSQSYQQNGIMDVLI
jgi:hypothetical protein